MAANADFVDRPEAVIDLAGGVLSRQPVVNNLILSLLAERIAHPQAGRYWVATDGGHPLGVVFQSPLDFPATLSPMATDAVVAIVNAIAGAGVALPGVGGEAGAAAGCARRRRHPDPGRLHAAGSAQPWLRRCSRFRTVGDAAE